MASQQNGANAQAGQQAAYHQHAQTANGNGQPPLTRRNVDTHTAALAATATGDMPMDRFLKSIEEDRIAALSRPTEQQQQQSARSNGTHR